MFTVAGSWDCSALVAQRVARVIWVPLVASFNDWFSYGWFPPHRVYRRIIEQGAFAAFTANPIWLCTSEGMREVAGRHSNATFSILWARFGRMLRRRSSRLLAAPAVLSWLLAVAWPIGMGRCRNDWSGSSEVQKLRQRVPILRKQPYLDVANSTLVLAATGSFADICLLPNCAWLCASSRSASSGRSDLTNERLSSSQPVLRPSFWIIRRIKNPSGSGARSASAVCGARESDSAEPRVTALLAANCENRFCSWL